VVRASLTRHSGAAAAAAEWAGQSRWSRIISGLVEQKGGWSRRVGGAVGGQKGGVEEKGGAEELAEQKI
jgi:hypothetical protein